MDPEPLLNDLTAGGTGAITSAILLLVYNHIKTPRATKEDVVRIDNDLKAFKIDVQTNYMHKAYAESLEKRIDKIDERINRLETSMVKSFDVMFSKIDNITQHIIECPARGEKQR